MRTLYIEGLAIHGDPESCVCRRKAAGEALTGAQAGSIHAWSSHCVTSLLLWIRPLGSPAPSIIKDRHHSLLYVPAGTAKFLRLNMEWRISSVQLLSDCELLARKLTN